MARGDRAFVETGTVIDDRESNGLLDPAELEVHLSGACVLDHVVQGLLSDAVERVLDLDRQALGEVGLEEDRQADPALHRRRVGPQGMDQAVLLEAARPQLEDQCPHLGQGIPLQVAQDADLLGRRGRITAQQDLDAAGDERHREQGLRHRIVELAGEVCPFVAGGQGAGLMAQLHFQPIALGHIADRSVRAGEAAVQDRRPGEELGWNWMAVVVEQI